jgi:serine protease Do
MLTFSLKDIRQGSYVIPVRVLAKVCNDLLLFGKVRYGYVGIETETMLDKSTGDLYQGVLKVHPHSPAEKAGIREGDVLNTLDGKNIRTREELVNGAFFTSPGQRVAVEYLRNGNPSKIYLEVGSRPDNGEK